MLHMSSVTSVFLLGPCCCLCGTPVEDNNQWAIPVDTIHFFLMSFTWTPGKQHTSLWVGSSCHMESTPIFHIPNGKMVGWQEVFHRVNDRTTAWPSHVQYPVVYFSTGLCIHSAPDFHQATGISAGLQAQSVTLFHAAELPFPPNTSTLQVTEGIRNTHRCII